MILAGKRGILLAAIAALAWGCAQLKSPLKNHEAENAQAHRQMAVLANKVETSLSTGDLASAQREALEYRAERDADPKLLAEWRQRIWTLSESWGTRDESRQAKREIKGAVAQRRKLYARERKMSSEAFVKWLAKQGK